MTNTDKLNITKSLIGLSEEMTDDLVQTYLSLAEDAIMSRRFPFGHDEDQEFPHKYDLQQCKLAARYFLRRGAEGEKQHNENGINRIYATVDDSDLLDVIMPLVGGLSR